MIAKIAKAKLVLRLQVLIKSLISAIQKNILPEKPRYINAGGKLLDLEIPKVMGILNITPDSFYKGSRYNYG